MFVRTPFVCNVGLLAFAAAFMFASAASATTYQVMNTTFGGGIDTCPASACPNAPVIGPSSVFGISGAFVSSSGNMVNITIDTAFSGVPTTSAADGTTYGSLFLNTSPIGTGVQTGVYSPGDWNYAAVMNGVTSNGVLQTSGTLNIYSIPSAQTANNYSGNTSVANYYQASNGQIIMSNVAGDPVTYPYAGNNAYWFREGEPVLFAPNAGITPFLTGTWSTSPRRNHLLHSGPQRPNFPRKQFLVLMGHHLRKRRNPGVGGATDTCWRRQLRDATACSTAALR